MKIVIYRESNKRVLEVEEGVNEIIDRGEDFIEWDTGAIDGSHHPILILPDSVEIEKDDTITQEQIDQDIAFVSEDQATNHEIDVLRKALRVTVAKFIRQDQLTEEELAEMIDIYPLFSVGVAYQSNYLVRFEGSLYEVIQDHTSQEDWTPPATPALFKKVQPEGVIPEWVEPTGVHDAYNVGDQVIYNGDVWESEIADNVWEPGEYGWFMV